MTQLKLTQTCNEMFLAENEYDKHVQSHLVKDYPCELCDDEFSTVLEIECHMEKEHIDAKRIKAEVLNEDLDEIFICGRCFSAFNSFSECQMHVESHNHKCYKCTFEAPTVKEVSTHEEKEHENYDIPQLHLCEKCGEHVSSKELLSKHIEEHNEDHLISSGSFF